MIIILKKTYKTRAGDKVKIVEKCDSQRFLGNNLFAYFINGKFRANGDNTDMDLVEEL